MCFEEVKGAPLEVKPWDTNFEVRRLLGGAKG